MTIKLKAGTRLGTVRIQPGGAAALIAESTWDLNAQDALDSGGNLTSWPAAKGPGAILDATFGTPTVVTGMNGKKTVRFNRSTGDLIVVNGDVNAVAGDHTLLAFYNEKKPAYYDAANQKRSYITFANNAGTARLGLGVHTANDQRIATSHRYAGFFNNAADGDNTPNAGWHNFTRADQGAPFVASVGGPQCTVTVLAAGGTSAFYRDGIVMGTSAFYVTTRAFYKGAGGRHTIGGETTEVAPTGPTFFDGDIYRLLYWPRALSAAEVAAVNAAVMADYAHSARSYSLPSEWSGVAAWYSSRVDPTCRDLEPSATTFFDMLGRFNLAATGTPAPASGVAVFDGVDDEYTISNALSNYVSASAYTLVAVINPTAISTSGAIPYNNDVIYSDASGFWGLHVRESAPASGVYQAEMFHWDGAAKVARATITLGAEQLLIGRFNGSTISLQVDSGTPATAPAGNISNLTSTMTMGGKPANTLYQYSGKIRALAIFNEFKSDADIAKIRTYFEAVRDA